MMLSTALDAASKAGHGNRECTVIWREGDNSRVYAVGIGNSVVMASSERDIYPMPREWWLLTLDDFYEGDWQWGLASETAVHIEVDVAPIILGMGTVYSLYPARRLRA